MPTRQETIRGVFGSTLARAARQWRRSVDQGLRPYGLTEATWLPLLRVSRSPKPMRQKELAASLSLDSSAVVRLLDCLEKAGLLERREDDTDRRAKTIVLTPDGQATVAQVEAVARQVREAALAELSDAEIETTFRVLEHICNVLSPACEEAAK
ncbi:MarR family transcriptional regulator, transcriptional regulator for hemolysin [Tistlia consotensis]|uniref:MarR family transcriptional regulator, transcriptional regulator for hemolysin n=1 Tax=Tistlia consotensis USBA 355 TaxID=560819 RepID=A0A1Y6B6L5_9PROT|nr:MarR family transcriptional regulator [Tistlia consotensis]SME90861.1 MarR family transcriptional regulator, transcriptional regulator for hemolysin [Tistlia consotensis USBA 355]SNR26973.1 MarR family transcriptional regulator, transcriptional regulator for hemolysin [Tistlia consotensis]